MRALDLIRKKRDGGELTGDELRFLIQQYVDEKIPDEQMSALLMAVYFQGMTEAETLRLTQAMAESGETVDFSDIDGFIADKHSTGGVGDKVSLVLVPLIAAAGLYIGKLSGRGLGHTGGTIDKLESIPSFHADLSLERFRELVREEGLTIVESSPRLAPADHKLYALRDATATVASVPLIAASILSKKLAVGSHGIVFDVKTGTGAILPEYTSMKRIAQLLVKTAQGAGRRATALLTDMSEPLGCQVGNALEVREAIETLQGSGPEDLRKLCLRLGGELLMMAGEAPRLDAGVEYLERLLQSGAAFEHFATMVRAQGGDTKVLEDPSRLPQADRIIAVDAPQAGYVRDLNARAVGEAAHLLGAGRSVKGQRIDHAVGVSLYVKIGDRVEAGEPLAILHVNDPSALERALQRTSAAIQISAEPVAPPPLIRERVH